MEQVFIALAVTFPTSAEAQVPSAFCRAVEALVREAIQTGQAQTPFVAQDEPFTFACGRRRGSPVQRAFCSAALEAVGLEFIHRFPWMVYDCLRREGLEPKIQTIEQDTGVAGRGRMIRLTARSPSGATIEIRYTPFEERVPVEEWYAGYRGRYDVTVAREH